VLFVHLAARPSLDRNVHLPLDLGLGRLFAVAEARTDGEVFKLAGVGHLRWLDAFLYRATTLDEVAVAAAPLGFPLEAR
jgi:hypothetical protein